MTDGSDDSEPVLVRDMGHLRNYSEETAAQIDNEIKRMVDEAYQRTEQLLKEHMDKLHRVAQYLFLEEKMSGEKFADIMVRESLPKASEENGEEPAAAEENKADE